VRAEQLRLRARKDRRAAGCGTGDVFEQAAFRDESVLGRMTNDQAPMTKQIQKPKSKTKRLKPKT
jgi:hypothetical protein